MNQKKFLAWFIAVMFVFSAIGVVWAKGVTVKATITKVEGSNITFKTEKGDAVKSKVSSKRTKVQGGKADDLKAGDKIEITYEADGAKNEPSLIKVLK